MREMRFPAQFSRSVPAPHQNPLEREFGRKAMYRMRPVVRLARRAREAFVHVAQGDILAFFWFENLMKYF